MNFPDSFIDEIKQRIPISKIIGKTVKLKRYGHSLKGLCPFHLEKTPSFTVNDSKGNYYCFGCHATGDVISFISEIEKLSFVDSVTILAETAGIALPKLSDDKIKKNEFKTDLINICGKANQWFASQLDISTNYFAKDYLRSRGIDENDIKQFSIGYAPRQGLQKYLNDNGFTNEQIINAGLLIKTDSNRLLERFHERIIFPIKTQKGQIVGFGARTLSQEVMPKYLNSPETELFKKNNLLYAAEIAKKFIQKNETLIVVEGYLDVIFMHKYGFKETVATLGTAFNETHLNLLWNLANEPILCFDGDDAGKKAMVKAAYTALPLLVPGQSLKFCLLPRKMDPDDILKTYGAEYMQGLLKNSLNLSEYIWQNEFSLITGNNPENKALFEHKITELVNQIENPIVKNYYKQFIKNRLWQEFNKNFTGSKQVKSTKKIILRSQIHNNDVFSAKERLEYSLFAQLLYQPSLLAEQKIIEQFTNFNIEHAELSVLQQIMLKCHEIDEQNINDLLETNNLVKLSEFLCGPYSSFVDTLSRKDVQNSVKIWFITYKKYFLELLKDEYAEYVQKFLSGDNNEVKLLELKKEIDSLVVEIAEEENNLT